MPTETQAITGTTHYFFEPFAQRTVIFHDFVVLDCGVLFVVGAIWTPCFEISNQQRRISKIGIIRRHDWIAVPWRECRRSDSSILFLSEIVLVSE